MPARADAIPMAAPAPRIHQAAMPAYARVVGEKPPFTQERAKMAAATPVPTATARKTRTCSAFTLGSATARYSIDRVRGAEPATSSCSRSSRSSSRRAAGRTRRMRRKTFGGAGLQRMPADGWRRQDIGQQCRKLHERRNELATRGHPEANESKAQEGRPGRDVAEEPRQGLWNGAPPPVALRNRRDGTNRRQLGLRSRLGPDSAPHRPCRHRRPSARRSRNTNLASVPPPRVETRRPFERV